MHMTSVKPTKPGWYWFIRAGSHPARPIPVRVIRRGRGLSYTTGGPGDSGWDPSWGDFDAVSTTSPEHLWSNEPIPEPSMEGV